MAELEIKDLHVTREGKEILKGVNLKTGPGEVHAIMGPNGSGKKYIIIYTISTSKGTKYSLSLTQKI
jgi:ABC-type transport system involved in Fe-S cluster assembly, ATPase component